MLHSLSLLPETGSTDLLCLRMLTTDGSLVLWTVILAMLLDKVLLGFRTLQFTIQNMSNKTLAVQSVWQYATIHLSLLSAQGLVMQSLLHGAFLCNTAEEQYCRAVTVAFHGML